MADKYATPVLDEGVYTPTLTTPLKGRQDPILGGIRDTILETAASAIDVMTTPYAYGRDFGASQGDAKVERAGQLGQQFGSQVKDWVRSGKTDFGRQEDKNGGENSSWLGNTMSAMVTSAPQLALAAMTGPAAPATFGALAHAQQSQQFEEMLSDMPRDELEKTAGWKKYKGQGMSDDDALRAMHKEMRDDPWVTIPNVLMNTVTGGIAGRIMSKVGSRTIAQTMTQRIMKGAGQELPEAVIGGAGTGAAQSYGRQRGEMDIGARDRYDFGEMAQEAKEMGTTLGSISAGGIGLRSVRGPRGKVRTSGSVTGDLIKDAANKPAAPEIDTEQRVVATENLKTNPIGDENNPAVTGEKPPDTGATAPKAPTKVTDVQDLNAPPEQVTPAGKAPTIQEENMERINNQRAAKGLPPLPPEHFGIGKAPEATAPVAPVEAAVPPEGGVRFRDLPAVEDTITELDRKSKALDAATEEVKATPEWAQEMEKTTKDLTAALDEHDRIKSATAPPEVPPEAAAAHLDITAPPEEKVAEKSAVTPAEFRERALDLSQTPKHDDLMAALKDFKDSTGKAYPESGKLMAEHAKLVKAARIQANEDRIAQQKAEKAIRVEADKVAKEEAKATAAEAKRAKDEAKAEEKATKTAEREAAKTEKAHKAKAQAQAAGYAGLAKDEKAKADAAERKRLKDEAKKAADQAKADKAEAEKLAKAPTPEERPTDLAALVETPEAKLPHETKPTPTPKPKPAAAEPAAKPAPRPKSLASRIAAHAKENPVERYEARDIIEPARYGPKGELYDTQTDKVVRKYDTVEKAKAEADLRNLEETKTASTRAIHEEDRVARTARGKAEPVVTREGKPAKVEEAPKPAGLVRKADIEAEKARKEEAKKVQAEEAEKQKARDADADRLRIRRDLEQKTRDHAAQSVVESNKARSHNMKGDLDATEAHVRDSEPAEATSGMRTLVERGKDMAAAYEAKLLQLRKGKDTHDTYMMGRGLEGTSRAGKGQWHSFLSDVRNLVREIEKALDRNPLHAKDLTLKYLDIMRAVEEGRIEDVTRLRKEFNDAVTTEVRTTKGGEGQIEAAGVETSKQKLDDAMAEVVKNLDARVLLADDKGKPILKDGRVQYVGRDETATADDVRPKQMTTPDTVGHDPADWSRGVKMSRNEARSAEISKALDHLWDILGRPKRSLSMDEVLHVASSLGEKVEKGNLGEELLKVRPESPILREVFDLVHGMVKDFPMYTMSPEMVHALSGNARAFYSPEWGAAVFRPDTKVPRTVYHEALHAATSRALYGSQRLQHLVTRLQGIIERKYAHDPAMQESLAYQKAIGWEDEKGIWHHVDQHEFISELFTRDEVRWMVQDVKLRLRDVRDLTNEGYKANLGQKLLGPMWDTFLKFIGYKPDAPSAMKHAIDMVQDVLDREMQLRADDVVMGRTDIGKIYSRGEIAHLASLDPVHGTAAHRAMMAGNHAEAARELMSMADKLDGKAADKAIEYLHEVNRRSWGMDVLPEKVTPNPTREKVQSDVVNWVESRLGKGAADKAWQAERFFRTPIRNIMKGFQYTQDIGNTLEKAFQNVLQPIKDAWARRDNFAQKYMDTSGANQLVDDIATAKHAFKDRNSPNSVWNKWENLLIRESYARTRADEELGVGANAHIKIGDRRDRQSVQDHARNRAILEEFKAMVDPKDPNDPIKRLLDLRNRIFDFTRRELDTRNKASIRDQLLSHKVVPHGDEEALAALVKDVRRDNKSMTASERAAIDRLLGDKDSPKYKAYEKAREDIRSIMEDQYHQGPHVPFSRYGKHAVYAEYDVRPDAGVKYNEVNPGADIHSMYDFVNGTDADNFIDHTLSHPDINITVRDAKDVIYDKTTGEEAAHWTVEKPDGTAKTYTSREEANAAMEKADTIKKTLTKPEDLKSMEDAGQDISNYETRHRVTFNPREFIRFESERDANNKRDELNAMFDTAHEMGEGPKMRTTPPNIRLKVSQVESPHDVIGRANVAYTSAEMRQWINRQEASPEYQRMDPEEKEAWARKLRDEAARVTATAGRRSMNMPREYTKGASTDILKGMIGYAASNARAIADLTYRADIEKGLVDAEAYVGTYRNQSGGIAGNHRARDDALREIKTRLFAPPQIEGSWAHGIKRALQVSMLGHLADTAYLIINAIEPWVFGAAISSSRHGWAPTYAEMGAATRLIEPAKLAAIVKGDVADAINGRWSANRYEETLLESVNGAHNDRGDGKGVGMALQHMFDKGLAARDVGLEVARHHDPSANIVGRGLDHVTNGFSAVNVGVETFNRAMMGVANYRLEYNRALKEMGLPPIKVEKYKVDGVTHTRSDYTFNQKAHDQAVRYAEDMIFKAAGDYNAWNNPRYFNNPMLRLATQFKKYPLRIASVYAEALVGAFKGQPEKQKQVAYMLIAQGIAAGGLGTPLASPFAGMQNAAYMLGLTDNNWEDVEFAMRQALAKHIGVNGAELALRGALRFSGIDFSKKLSNNSFIFYGSPQDRNVNNYAGTLAKMALGAPLDTFKNSVKGMQQIFEGSGQMLGGNYSQGMTTSAEGVTNIAQIKILTDIFRAGDLAINGHRRLPQDTPVHATDILATATGFQPTHISNKLEAKQVIEREKKQDSAYRKKWTDRWLAAKDNPTQQSAIWGQIQKNNQGIEDPRLRLTYDQLWKAQQRKKNETRRDDTKLGVKLSGRQKAYADIGNYFDID